MSEPSTARFDTGLWHLLFAVGHPELIAKQKGFQVVGTPPRCKLCLAPFGSVPEGGFSRDQPGPSNRNPRYCSLCDAFIRQNPGGAKVTMSVVFADVRGSTRLSEALGLEEYVRRMNDFYRRVTGVFVETDGFMMDVIGDEVFALYPSGFSGVQDGDARSSEAELARARASVAAGKALEAARRLVHLAEGAPAESFPFGVSVHSGEVYVGTVRGAEEGISDIRVWGPEVNRAARLCGQARAGEALVSNAVFALAGVEPEPIPERLIDLKGFSQATRVRVLGGS